MNNYQEEVKRSSGRTTLISEHCVQRLIDEGFVVCYDHYLTRQANQLLFSQITSNRKLNNYLECISNDYVKYVIRTKEIKVNAEFNLTFHALLIKIESQKINPIKE